MSELRSILDTSVIIDDYPDPIPGELAISTITLAELWFGLQADVGTDERAQRTRRYARVDRTFDALPVDEAVAESYGLLADAVRRHGRRARSRSMDLLIAATAHVHDARLVTSNPADFEGLDAHFRIVPPHQGGG